MPFTHIMPFKDIKPLWLINDLCWYTCNSVLSKILVAVGIQVIFVCLGGTEGSYCTHCTGGGGWTWIGEFKVWCEKIEALTIDMIIGYMKIFFHPSRNIMCALHMALDFVCFCNSMLSLQCSSCVKCTIHELLFVAVVIVVFWQVMFHPRHIPWIPFSVWFSPHVSTRISWHLPSPWKKLDTWTGVGTVL